LFLAVSLIVLVAGCGGGGDDRMVTVACDDAAFRAQDEELYVTKTAVANALGGAGDRATVLLDLRRARTALATYLDAHPPCAGDLVDIAVTEREAIGALDQAIAALAAGDDARAQLARARASLASAQSALASGAP
jgi:hypothetical protein